MFSTRCVLVLLLSLGAVVLPAQTKDSFTPMALDSGFGRIDHSDPAMPPEEIIRRFAAKESEFKQALNHYTFRRVARVQTLDDEEHGKVDGEWFEIVDVVFEKDGRRSEHVVNAPASSLSRIQMTQSDMADIEHGYSFVLTTEEIAQYDVRYIGRQKVDEVGCYVFEVKPKVIEKKKRYFEGRVWVDDEDLQIVVSSGRMVPNGTRKGEADLHPPFMTWREQVDGHYWFPVYTKGEGILHFAGGHGFMGQEVHIRETVKYTDYKQYGSSARVLYQGEELEGPKKNSDAVKQKNSDEDEDDSSSSSSEKK